MSRFLLALSIAAALSACASGGSRKGPKLENGARADVALLETTDLHANVLSFDYFKGVQDPTLGFERVATLIRAARKEFPNAFLFDDGDRLHRPDRQSRRVEDRAVAHPGAQREARLEARAACADCARRGGAAGRRPYARGSAAASACAAVRRPMPSAARSSSRSRSSREKGSRSAVA